MGGKEGLWRANGTHHKDAVPSFPLCCLLAVVKGKQVDRSRLGATCFRGLPMLNGLIMEAIGTP
jgi:hypothetical protein